MVAEDILAAVALTVATGAATGLTEGGKAAFAELVRTVRRRFARNPSAQVTLAEATSQPEDNDRVQALRAELVQAVADDPTFGLELRRLWQDLSPRPAARDDGVANNVSGTVSGNVVQARDVHGGISFGDPR